MADKNLTQGRQKAKLGGMESELTLGRMLLMKCDELGIDLEEAAQLTGLSWRHLQRIADDEGHTPQQATIEKLLRLGLTKDQIKRGAFRTKVKALEAKLDPASDAVLVGT